MAKFTGLLRKMDGSVGDLTFRKVNGQTVVSEKVVKPANPQTTKQMYRRAQFLNVLAFGRLINTFNHPAFEAKPKTMSDINAFTQANLGIVPVFITKGDRLQGGCVVAPYQVTRGSLPALVLGHGTGDVAVTNINVGSLSITNSTTVKAFSQAIVNNNEDWQMGDQLSIYLFTQSVNSETNVPCVNMQAFEITLAEGESAEEDVVRDLLPATVVSVVDNCIGAGATVNGGIVYIHSRKAANGKTLVSTQNVLCSNSILTNYQSAAQAQVSMESLGWKPSEEPFLTPNIDDILLPVTP